MFRFCKLYGIFRIKSFSGDQNDKLNLILFIHPITDADYELNNFTSRSNHTVVVYNSLLTRATAEDMHDPLLVVKSEMESSATVDGQSNEFVVKSEMESSSTFSEESNEFIVNDNVIQDERIRCRLCLTEEDNNWIDIFSTKPYPYSNVGRRTPRNIVEMVEKCTTIKVIVRSWPNFVDCKKFFLLFFQISKDDQLPDKLCLMCFQGLRFVYKFRETSLRSQDILTSEAKEQNEPKKISTYAIPLRHGNKVVWPVQLQPLRKPEPYPKKRRSVEGAGSVEKDDGNAPGAQCEICGEIFTKSKTFQHHLNRHHGRCIGFQKIISYISTSTAPHKFNFVFDPQI